MKKNTGFTLVELLITIAIVGVLLTVGLPSLKIFMKGNQLVAATNELVAAFTVARSEAIKLDTNVTICESTNGTSCTTGLSTGNWQDGWIVFVDTNSDRLGTGAACAAVGSDCLLRVHAAYTDNQLTISGTDVTTSAAVSSTTFNSRGLPRSSAGAQQAANFNVCSLDDSNNTIDSRAMVLSLTGRVRVSDNSAVITLCP